MKDWLQETETTSDPRTRKNLKTNTTTVTTSCNVTVAVVPYQAITQPADFTQVADIELWRRQHAEAKPEPGSFMGAPTGEPGPRTERHCLLL